MPLWMSCYLAIGWAIVAITVHGPAMETAADLLLSDPKVSKLPVGLVIFVCFLSVAWAAACWPMFFVKGWKK